MNFLAHIFLSGDNKELQIGNFIGDFVKGSNYTNYPVNIANGILLHRSIDEFTDKHNKFQEAKELLHPLVGRYSGIFVDMYYDHFLAKNWHSFSHTPLKRFSRNFYLSMIYNYRILPKQVRNFLPHLILSNRLNAYASLKGLHDSLEIMETFTSLPKKSLEAMELLKTNYNEFNKNFLDFFPEIQLYTEEKIKYYYD